MVLQGKEDMGVEEGAIKGQREMQWKEGIDLDLWKQQGHVRRACEGLGWARPRLEGRWEDGKTTLRKPEVKVWESSSLMAYVFPYLVKGIFFP